MRVFDSNKQAIADTQLEQCYGLTATVVIGSKTKELSYDYFFSFFAETQLREPVFGSGFFGISLNWRNNCMAKYALYVSLKAKPGKEKDVEAFLRQGAEMSKKEEGTVSWFGMKEDKGSYSVFDTFNDEAGRDAHLNGEIAKALMANAETLFSEAPKIHKINIVAHK